MFLIKLKKIYMFFVMKFWWCIFFDFMYIMFDFVGFDIFRCFGFDLMLMEVL